MGSLEYYRIKRKYLVFSRPIRTLPSHLRGILYFSPGRYISSHSISRSLLCYSADGYVCLHICVCAWFLVVCVHGSWLWVLLLLLGLVRELGATMSHEGESAVLQNGCSGEWARRWANAWAKVPSEGNIGSSEHFLFRFFLQFFFSVDHILYTRVETFVGRNVCDGFRFVKLKYSTENLKWNTTFFLQIAVELASISIKKLKM